jgi:hypothetical protein
VVVPEFEGLSLKIASVLKVSFPSFGNESEN